IAVATHSSRIMMRSLLFFVHDTALSEIFPLSLHDALPICDTARTLSKAASLIMENGAASVRAVCTHPVLSGEAYDTIEKSELTELIVTDTIPLQRQSEKIKVLSTAGLFANAIKNVNEHGISYDLFKLD